MCVRACIIFHPLPRRSRSLCGDNAWAVSPFYRKLVFVPLDNSSAANSACPLSSEIQLLPRRITPAFLAQDCLVSLRVPLWFVCILAISFYYYSCFIYWFFFFFFFFFLSPFCFGFFFFCLRGDFGDVVSSATIVFSYIMIIRSCVLLYIHTYWNCIQSSISIFISFVF